jgi:hypothetical protein
MGNVQNYDSYNNTLSQIYRTHEFHCCVLYYICHFILYRSNILLQVLYDPTSVIKFFL